MENASKVKSRTDWDRVKRGIAEDAPIPYNPKDGPYDPNDDAAVGAYWASATIRRGRGPQKAPTKEAISIRLMPDVLEYFRATGDGWQGRINGVLSQYVKRRRDS